MLTTPNQSQQSQPINHIGLLLTKDESPILPDVLDANLQYLKKVYVLDGGSDNAREILEQYPEICHYVHENDLQKQLNHPLNIVDGIRGYLLDIIREKENGNIWITIMHGDEIFYHDPREAAEIAEFAGANCVEWYAPHFFLHKNDYKNWETLSQKPLRERIRYYAHHKGSCWTEMRQFKLDAALDYDKNKHSCVLPLPKTAWRPLPVHPIYFHYKVWNADIEAYNKGFVPGNKNLWIRNLLRLKLCMRSPGKWSRLPFFAYSSKSLFRKKLHKYSEVSFFDGSFGELEIPYNAYRADYIARRAGCACVKGLKKNSLETRG